MVASTPQGSQPLASSSLNIVFENRSILSPHFLHRDYCGLFYEEYISIPLKIFKPLS
jgi:hypothetical protein